MNPKLVLERNVKAIKTALSIEKENRNPTNEEIRIISDFNGWGGIKAVLYPIDKDWVNFENISKQDLSMEASIKELYTTLSDAFPERVNEIWGSIKEATLTSFYTPKELVDKIIQKHQETNPDIQSFLDPSAGMGVYIDSVLKYYPKIQTIQAVEKDFLTALLLRIKYQNNNKVKVINSGFEDVKFSANFDFIASNIPFGDVSVSYPSYGTKITSKIHNFFAYHSTQLLNEGGKLSLISSAGLMNSPSNQSVRELISENCLYNSLITLPKNLFKENGTEVTSQLISLTKKSILSEKEKLQNSSFVNTYKDDTNVSLNEFVVKYGKVGFLGVKPILSHNQYGQPEYNYEMSSEELLDSIDRTLNIRNSVIQRVYKKERETIIFDKLPIVSNVEEQAYQLLRVKLPTNSQTGKLKLNGIIKARYKGYEIPIATIMTTSIKEGSDLQRRVYIDPYIKNQEFYQSKGEFLNPKDFREEWQKFTLKLQDFAEKFELEVALDSNIVVSSDEFEHFFSKTFKQPELRYRYFESLSFFNFHKKVEKGMLYIDLEGEVNRVVDFVNNEFTADENKIYKVERVKFPSPNEEKFISELLNLYSTYNDFVDFEQKVKDYKRDFFVEEKYHTAFEKKTNKFIQKLNHIYDEFFNEFGAINDNARRIKKWSNDIYPILSALEISNDEGNEYTLFSEKLWKKADIFSATYQREDNSVSIILSSEEAIIKSINSKGYIDSGYVELLTGKEWEIILQETKNIIIYNPIIGKYELRDIFLSGEIYEKIRAVESIDIEDEFKREALEELHRVLPEKIPFFKIEKQFGTRWIPLSIVKDFSDKYFGNNFIMDYNQNTDVILVKELRESDNFKNYKQRNGRTITSADILENAYYDKYPIVTYTEEIDGEKVTYQDKDAMQFYRREISRLRSSFINYLAQLSDEKKNQLEQYYNENFNGVVLPKANGELLDFSEMKFGNINVPDMYSHQKNAIWQMLQNRGGIVDHEVGFGKTLTMCGLANKMKSLNIAKKPLMIGLKANVNELVSTYKKLFPEAKVLYPSKQDWGKNREIFLNKIKNNDWDIIIMGHSQFMKIPQDERILLEVYEKELQDIEANLFAVQGWGLKKKQLLGLEQRKKTLTSKRDRLIEKLNKYQDDNVLSFSSLGIDHIIIDESHKFKNLEFQTRHDRVAGLGKTSGGSETANVLTALRTIQKNMPNKEFGATFFSGTPISNSLTELYSLQKYLTPITLQRKGIQNFDSWASNFTKKSIEFEANMVNEIVSKERFRYFINMPELSLMYSQMAHIMNDRVSPGLVDRPKKEEHLLNTEQTPIQKKFFRHLASFLETGNDEKLRLEKPINQNDKNKALSLLAVNLSFKASIDMRLINSAFPDDPNSKINTMVKDVLEYYHRFDEQKGTQIIFSDLGVSKKKLSFQEMEDNYNSGIFTSVYDDIKYKLMKAGIPEKEIAFAQDYDGDEQKRKLNEKMNKGEIRVLLGSTQTAGTGLNVQERLISMKHLTIPWKPSEFEQRNGRGYRKGNMIAKNHNNNEVDITIMTTAQTLDNYKIDLNRNKAVFIDQLRSSTSKKNRVADEGDMDENGMNFAELQAELMGDNSLLEKSKVDRRLKELLDEKSFVAFEVSEGINRTKQNIERIESLNKIIELQEKDLECYNNNLQYDEKGNKINKPHYIGLPSDSKKEEIIEHLLDIQNKMKFGKIAEKELLVAEMYGFELKAKNDFWKGVIWEVNRKGNDFVKYSVSEGYINSKTANNYFMNCFRYIDNKIEGNKRSVRYYEEENEKLKIRTQMTFDKDEEIAELQEKSLELEMRIKENSAKNKVEFNCEEVVVENEKRNFIFIDSTKKLDEALLLDRIGEDMRTTATLFSPEIADIFSELSAENKNIELFNSQNINGKVLISYRIKDTYMFYDNFNTFMVKKGLEINESVNQKMENTPNLNENLEENNQELYKRRL